MSFQAQIPRRPPRVNVFCALWPIMHMVATAVPVLNALAWTCGYAAGTQADDGMI